VGLLATYYWVRVARPIPQLRGTRRAVNLVLKCALIVACCAASTVFVARVVGRHSTTSAGFVQTGVTTLLLVGLLSTLVMAKTSHALMPRRVLAAWIVMLVLSIPRVIVARVRRRVTRRAATVGRVTPRCRASAATTLALCVHVSRRTPAGRVAAAVGGARTVAV
jgi:hypothetical protein